MISLQNFETQIDQAILQRGKQYYSQNAVSWLEETEENTWQAEVDGTATYQVTVTLTKDNQLSSYFCDCPYDGSPCKHAVAVFFALRKAIKNPKTEKQNVNAQRNVFQKLLQSISLSEYQEFIRHYATKDKNFRTEFELYFAAKDDRIDVGQKYHDLIKKLIRKHSDRGFIDYRATYGLSKEVNKLLASGQDFMQKNNFRDAFTLATVVLKEMMEVVTESDDSNGNIGETISNAIELIEDIATANNVAVDLKEQVINFLQQELNNKYYFDYGDYGYYLVEIFQNLAVQLNQADAFLGFIDAQIPKLSGPYDNYQKEFFQKQKIEFLAAIGKTDEAEMLVQQNLNIVEVRQSEVEKALAKKDFAAAKRLITDGIQVAENQDHPGTVAAWQKQLLRIAVLENDTRTIRHYAKYFAFDRGFSKEYYNQWKATFTPAEWHEVIESYIRETTAHILKNWKENKDKYWRPAHPPLLQKLGPVYIEEQYWDRLLTLVQQQNNLETTLTYHEYLAQRYPTALLEIYQPALAQYGQQASGRGAYADLVAKMKKIIQDIPEGKEKILTIARSLKAQFPRRPAMQEELNKILK